MSTENDKESRESIGDRVRVIRVGLGMSQKKFAEQLNVLQPVVSYVESGSRNIPKDMLKALINLGFSYQWILTGKDEPEPEPTNEELQELFKSYDVDSERYKLVKDIILLMQDLTDHQIECVKSFILGMKAQEKLQK